MDLQNRIVGVVGRRGSGKSTMARRLLERSARVFVFDAMGEHRWIPNRFGSLDEVEEFIYWSEAQKAFAGAFVPERGLEQEFEELAQMIYERGNLVFGVEEIPMLCTPSHLSPELDRLVRLGRHRRVSLVWTAQRMTEVARRLTAATDWFILFRHTEPRDLDSIAERCGAEVAEAVATLPIHGYLVWDVIASKEVAIESLLTEGVGSPR